MNKVPKRVHNARSTASVIALATSLSCGCLQSALTLTTSAQLGFVLAKSSWLQRIGGFYENLAQVSPLYRGPRKWNLDNSRGLRGGKQEEVQMAMMPGYKVPSMDIVHLVDATPSPTMMVQPSEAGAHWVLLLQPSAMLELADLAEEELKLAGVRLLVHADTPSRRIGYASVSLLNRTTRQELQVTGLPPGRIFDVKWSPCGLKVGLTVLTPSQGLFLYTFSPEEPQATRACERRLSSAFAASYSWADGGRQILCNTVPMSRGPLPQRSKVPDAPLVQACEAGNKAPARTYQDLLVDAHDEALFSHFCTTQLVLVDDCRSGGTQRQARNLGEPAMLVYFKASPNAQFVLVEALREPLSRVVLWNRFAKDVTVLSVSGGSEPLQVAALPLAEAVPIGRDAVREGPRRHAWRPDEPATLTWVEALDGGDPKAVVPHRDAIWMHNIADGTKALELARTQYRYSDMWWGGGSLDPWGGWVAAAEEGEGREGERSSSSVAGDCGDVVLVRENDWKTRESRVWQVLPGSSSGGQPSLGFPAPLLKYISEDRYEHPGTPMSVLTSAGTVVMRRDRSGRVLFSGTGGRKAGASASETLVLVTTQETQTEPPQLVQRRLELPAVGAVGGSPQQQPLKATDQLQFSDMKEGSPGPPAEPITNFPHPQPALIGVSKELIKYKRDLDGLELSGMLYTPAGYDGASPLPTILWAYPREYKSAASASQVTGSPYKFILVPRTSPLLWLTRGYAVLDNPSMPIVGEDGQEENDRFVEQLTSNAEAAVKELVRRGVTDHRVAIGGHSYGAFMATNLLAHTKLFQAGIGRSGAYNRLLTPFGFQSEERTLWEAPEVYLKMSPFANADKIEAPLLLLHGAQDNNPGTLPLQSERMYSALKGLGKETRLVMLPLESHSYQARESVLHMCWEMDAWLGRHLV